MKKTMLKALSVLLVFTMIFTSTSLVAYAKASISNSSISLKVGMGKKLKVNGAGWKDPVWTSSNKKIATVSRNGNVVALQKGTCTVTAKLGKKKYKCKVTVTAGNSFNTKPSDYNDYDYYGDAIIWPAKIWYSSDGKVKVKIKIKNDSSKTNTIYIQNLYMTLTATMKNGSTKEIAYGNSYPKGLTLKLKGNASVYKTISLERAGGVDFKKVKVVDYDYEYDGEDYDDDYYDDDYYDDDYDY